MSEIFLDNTNAKISLYTTSNGYLFNVQDFDTEMEFTVTSIEQSEELLEKLTAMHELLKKKAARKDRMDSLVREYPINSDLAVQVRKLENDDIELKFDGEFATAIAKVSNLEDIEQLRAAIKYAEQVLKLDIDS